MKLYNIEEIPIPKHGEVFLFRAKADALLYYKKNSGRVEKLQFNDGVYLIPDKTITSVSNFTDEIIDYTIFAGGIIIRFSTPSAVMVGGGGSRGFQGTLGTQGAQGAQGTSGSSAAIIEAGTFSISASGATGDVNGVPIVPVNNGDGTWTMTIPTIDQLALVHLNSSSNTIVDVNNYKYSSSYGKDNAVQADSLATLNQKVAGTLFVRMVSDLGNSISINDKDGNGWIGIVQNIQPTSYQILWAQNGSGLLTFVWWHGIMG